MVAGGRKKITLKDIAQRAEVSTALVSNILNGKGRASEKVRTKVLGMLEEAGYRPKYARRSFFFLLDLDRITGSGKTIPVMKMLKGAEQTLADEGIHLQVEFLSSNGNDRPRTVTQQMEAILERRPGGVFIGTDESWLERACSFFEKAGVPVVQIGYDTELARYRAVVVDGFSGAYAAVQYLADAGHQRIGTLRWEWGLSGVNSTKKHAGFRAAMAERGLAVRDEYIKSMAVEQGNPDWHPSRVLVDELLALPEPPTALFVENSWTSVPLLYPLPEDRSKLPESLSALEMVHFEDWPLDPVEDIVSGKLAYPSRMSTVLAIDWEAIGRYAARMLVDTVRDNNTAETRIVRLAPVLQQIQGFSRKPIEFTHEPTGGKS
ncbi:MAG: LacI family DNA-binding transcriptional regulator [Chitinivibrionales bacterium]|nr:LacI family DNA-binding transcriptional regulator [Chitinivibrionales bacterium]